MVASIPNDVFQFSTFSALKAGFSQGQPSAGDLTSHGDHGIGTFEDGSLMMLVDSRAYSIAKEGKATIAPLQARLPFAMVTIFQPRVRFDGLSDFGFNDLDSLVSQLSNTGHGGPNTVLPFKILGEFVTIRLEVGSGEEAFRDVEGSIFGYIVPQWMSSISGPKYHCHFMSGERKDNSTGRIGGRVLDFKGTGKPLLSMGKCGRFHLGKNNPLQVG
jgi:alpha-acetolactate decarboxylase